MGKRITKITMVVAITVVLVLGLASVALASSWTDLPDSVLASYGISNAQVNQISQGYTNGTWKPYQSISWAQFTKMADATFGIGLAYPDSPTFSDVPSSNYYYGYYYYGYIEGAYAAGLVNGVTPTTFAPFSTLTREQAVAITPTGGKGGTVVTITGSGFVGVTAVKFGSVPAASYIVQSDSLITAVAPAGTAGSTVDVTVTASTGTSAAAPFTYDALPAAPTVTLINPVSGPTGTTVIITGTGFLGATAVTFGTIPATSFIVANDGLSITAEAPAGTVGSTVDVTVTTSAGTSAISALDKFFYGTAPVVAYITPTTGPAGTLVTINGSGFAGVTGVTFGAIPATQITYDTPYRITAVAPTGLAGPPVDVVVTTPAGSSATSAASKYSYGAPQADVALALTTPDPTVDGNSITGGGAVKTVAVSVVNGTASVVLTGTKLAGQAVAIAGANGAVVSAAGTDIAPTYTVDTSTVSAGGEMVFTLTVSETGKADVVYTVTVTVAANPAAITEFTIDGQTGATEINEADKTIALTMPAGTEVAALVPTITITGASVSPASEVAQDFTSPVTYTVTAADATTQTYTVTVTVAANPAAAKAMKLNWYQATVGSLPTTLVPGHVNVNTPAGSVTLILNGVITLTPSTEYVLWASGLTGYTGTSLATDPTLGLALGTFTTDAKGAGAFHFNIRTKNLPAGTLTVQLAVTTYPIPGTEVAATHPFTVAVK